MAIEDIIFCRKVLAFAAPTLYFFTFLFFLRGLTVSRTVEELHKAPCPGLPVQPLIDLPLPHHKSD